MTARTSFTTMASLPVAWTSARQGPDEQSDEGTPLIASTSTRSVPYTLFTTSERGCLVVLITFAAWISTASSFIYYPAIPAIAKDLHASVEMINLSITSYLIVSAVAPPFAGDASDLFGRRPLYIVTLTLYFATNIAIALQHSPVALLALRMLQSAGISGKDLADLVWAPWKGLTLEQVPSQSPLELLPISHILTNEAFLSLPCLSGECRPFSALTSSHAYKFPLSGTERTLVLQSAHQVPFWQNKHSP